MFTGNSFIRDFLAQVKKLDTEHRCDVDDDTEELDDGYEWCIVTGTPICQQAEIFARIVSQAIRDDAERVTFKLDEGKFFYTVAGQEYEMYPLPVPVFCDLTRSIFKYGKFRTDASVTINVPLRSGVRSLVAEINSSSPWQLVVHGFKPNQNGESKRGGS